MSMYENETNESKSAPDIAKKANLTIWMYFFLCGLVLWFLIFVVDVYFRILSEREAYVKIESVEFNELKDLRAYEEEVLSGKKGVLEGKRNISIDNAMNQFLEVIR